MKNSSRDITRFSARARCTGGPRVEGKTKYREISQRRPKVLMDVEFIRAGGRPLEVMKRREATIGP